MSSIAKNALARLANRRGETLTEVLVAILISGLAILLLATTIAASVNMNLNTRNAFNRYYDAGKAIAELSDEIGEGTVTLMAVDGDVSTAASISDSTDKSGIDIKYYGEEGTDVVAYIRN